MVEESKDEVIGASVSPSVFVYAMSAWCENAHASAIRCIQSDDMSRKTLDHCSTRASRLWTGGLDQWLKEWAYDPRSSTSSSSSSSTTLTLTKKVYHDSGWILSLTWHSEHPHLGEIVVYGGQKGDVHVLNAKDLASLQKYPFAHSSAVCSLSWTANHALITGSWDETAKVWCLVTQSCLWILRGHENHVQVLGWLDDDCIVTGSSGYQGYEGQLMGYQLRVWHKEELVETRAQHLSSIRCLCQVSSPLDPSLAFASASNDGSVMLWTRQAQWVRTIQVTLDGLVLFAQDIGKSRLATVDTSSNSTCIWDYITEALIQRIPIASWCVCALGGCQDIAIGCSDGSLRIYSFDPDATRPDEKQCLLATASTAFSTPQSKQMQQMYPRVEDQFMYKGKDDGQISLFCCGRTGQVDAFRWAQKSAEWKMLGSIQEPVRKEELNGAYFDRVVHVEIDSASMGMLHLMLGFNLVDDPKAVAEEFCANNNLPDEYIDQVKLYIAYHQ